MFNFTNNTQIDMHTAIARGTFAPVRPVNAKDWNIQPKAGFIALESSGGNT